MPQPVKYLPALITAIVWGSTFVASNHLIVSGVSKFSLIFFRFTVAYALLWCVRPMRLPFEGWRREALYAVAGLSGGSVYFLCEYSALQHTTPINVGLITSTVPIAAVAIEAVLTRRLPGRQYAAGTVVALAGVALVVLAPVLKSGDYSALCFNVVGDALAVFSTLLWAVYTIALDRVPNSVSPFLVSRRLFFYALVSIAPFALPQLCGGHFAAVAESPANAAAMAYLGVVASALCMWLWNVSINTIGLLRTNIFLYLLPVVSFVAAALYDPSSVTLWHVLGTALIFGGIVVADKK